MSVVLSQRHGTKLKLNNYRSISMLPQMYQLYTRILTNRLSCPCGFFPLTCLRDSEKEVRQECCLSPVLFNEMFFNKNVEYKTIRYEDD